MFELTKRPIDAAVLMGGLRNPSAGALVTFEGWVRNQNEGRDVLRLEYEAYAKLAENEGAKILEAAAGRFDVIEVACVHRVGRLNVGEMAVWVGVTAVHRADAFAACQHIIDEVKHRVPIWKKEHYADGDTGWVHCHACDAPTLSRSEVP